MKRIVRSHNNRVLAGVCGGFAEYFKLDPALIRLVWIFFTLFGGSGILAYILAIIVIPDSEDFSVKSADETELGQARILWGLLLLVVGVILILQHGHLFRIIWNSFWGSGINILFALAIIGLGIYLIYTQKTKLKTMIGKESPVPLHSSDKDKKLLGVCGGIAETLRIDSTIIRFLWVFGTIMSAGIGIILYIILAAVLPCGVPKPEKN